MKTAYIGGIILDGTRDMVPQKGKTVIVENGRIADIISADELVPSDCRIVNIRGCYLMPGLINLHVHLNSGGKPSARKKEPGDYVRLAESVGIDTIINKKRVTASNIFRFTMSTDVQAIRCLSGSEAEVLEFIVKPNSPATKCMIKDMRLPQDVIIGGIVRGDKVFIAVGDTRINAYDRVVVFSMPGSIATIGEFFN